MKQIHFWIDNIRAIAMISMIAFHAVWDLVYLYGMDWDWYRSDMVMYFLIALLEDCGYMARATVVLDPIFKKVGLSGKSVI